MYVCVHACVRVCVCVRVCEWVHAHTGFVILIWTDVECFISRCAQSASEWQLYSTIFCFQAVYSIVICDFEWVTVTLHSVFLNIHQNCYMASLVPYKTAAISALVLCTPYNRAPVYSVTLWMRVSVCMCVGGMGGVGGMCMCLHVCVWPYTQACMLEWVGVGGS